MNRFLLVLIIVMLMVCAMTGCQKEAPAEISAKEKDLLIVPGEGFGCAGWVRLCYCVSYDTIVRSLPLFKALIK